MSTPPFPSTPLLRVEDLAVSFANGRGPRIQAVDGIRMTVYPRQTLAVVGESGCGKSVTAMSTLQLIPRPPGRFDRGRILFQDRQPVPDGSSREIDLLSLDAHAIRRIRGNQIAMIFQEPMTSLNPVYTIGDQITEAIELHQAVGRGRAREIAARAMADVGIADPEPRLRAYPHEFSGGMRQRVMIAMALVCRPRLLLADEPTTALDVTIQAQILALLRSLQHSPSPADPGDAGGLGIMLITHALGVVAESADVVCVMYAGRVVEYATVPDLFRNPLHPYTRGLLASIPRLGERRDRLVTIREVIDNPAEFVRFPRARDGVRPWWPRHEPPADLARAKRPAGDYKLIESEPGHWVGVWRTAAVAAERHRAPDLDFRRPMRTEAACAS